jgi:hypothetical protein
MNKVKEWINGLWNWTRLLLRQAGPSPEHKAALYWALGTIGAVLVLTGVVLIRGRNDPTGLTLFAREHQAQLHCPKDSVDWVNLRSGVIWCKQCGGYYGKTVSGAYVCDEEVRRMARWFFQH